MLSKTNALNFPCYSVLNVAFSNIENQPNFCTEAWCTGEDLYINIFSYVLTWKVPHLQLLLLLLQRLLKQVNILFSFLCLPLVHWSIKIGLHYPLSLDELFFELFGTGSGFVQVDILYYTFSIILQRWSCIAYAPVHINVLIQLLTLYEARFICKYIYRSGYHDQEYNEKSGICGDLDLEEALNEATFAAFQEHWG